jgi:hypothetical protein
MRAAAWQMACLTARSTVPKCDPVGGGNLSNLDAHTGRYSCLAYNKKNDDGTIEGYGFTATVNYEKFSYQWHLGNQ